MKVSIAVAAIVYALLGAGCGRPGDPGSAPPAVTAHDTHSERAPPPVLPAGQQWATDEPLRTAMTRIRSALEPVLPEYQQGRLKAESAQALADAVEADVSYMVENCKLEPEPDAALHVLIGRMMGAAGAMRADPGSPGGVPQLAAVLRDYGATFDHPGWTQLPAAHPSDRR